LGAADELRQVFSKKINDDGLRFDGNDVGTGYILQKTCTDVSDVCADVQKRIAGFGQITQDLYGRPIKFPSQIDMPSDEFIWHYCDLESVCGGDFRKFFGKR
jgi:hypothetical protein